MKSIRVENLVWEMLLEISKRSRSKPEVLIKELVEERYRKK